MGFQTKFGFVSLEAIESALEGWGITEIRIWDREVLQEVCQWLLKRTKEVQFLNYPCSLHVNLEKG